MTAKAQIARWGNSLAVRIPKTVADEAGFREGDVLVLNAKAGSIAITAAERPLTLDEIVAQITPENLHREVNWGDPVGAEVW